MELLIGKEGNQPFKIADPYVSKKHAKLSLLPDGSYVLEDLNSMGGTYLLGEKGDVRQIIKCTVKPGTKIRLGGQYIVSINDFLPYFEGVAEEERKKQEEEKRKSEESRKIRDEEERTVREFSRLKKVYEDYLRDKIDLQRNMAVKNFYRSLPSVISTLLFGLTMLLGENEWVATFRPFIGLLMVVFIGITTFQMYQGQKEQPAKMEELNRQFMIDYVCPKCRNFLGFIPFEALVNKKQCPVCKSKWV